MRRVSLISSLFEGFEGPSDGLAIDAESAVRFAVKRRFGRSGMARIHSAVAGCF